jgi:hypothetical protein
VLAGNVERADFLLDDLQQEHGFALLCTTFPRSDVTVVTNQEKVRNPVMVKHIQRLQHAMKFRKTGRK